MIAISGLLVLAAIALLIVGLVLSSFVLVYASIGVSLVSAVCWVVGVYLGRDQLRGRGGKSTRSAKTGAAAKGGKGGARKRPAAASKASGRKTSGQRAQRPAGRQGAAAKGGSATTVAPPDDATVVVVPGRLRYHLSTCRQAGGRETEELELADAREQGYVACTACRPDSVLAARADQAAVDPDDPDAEDADADPADPEADPADSEAEDSEAEDSDTEKAAADETAADETRVAETAPDDTARVAAVTGQRRYHLETCQVVQDARDDETEVRDLTVDEARDDGLTPCRVCGAPTA